MEVPMSQSVLEGFDPATDPPSVQLNSPGEGEASVADPSPEYGMSVGQMALPLD